LFINGFANTQCKTACTHPAKVQQKNQWQQLTAICNTSVTDDAHVHMPKVKDRRLAADLINQSINQNAQPAMLAGQLTLTHYHVTPEPRRE
jgi:hypothetical protein